MQYSFKKKKKTTSQVFRIMFYRDGGVLICFGSKTLILIICMIDRTKIYD